MTILKNFDFDALRKERARLNATGGVDLVSAINQIAPDIAKLAVGETAKIAVPEGLTVRKHVMSITAKLNNLTPKGAPWAGRNFRVINDGKGYTYVQRGEDTPKNQQVERKKGGGGGRKKKAADATPPASTEGTKVQEHA